MVKSTLAIRMRVTRNIREKLKKQKEVVPSPQVAIRI